MEGRRATATERLELDRNENPYPWPRPWIEELAGRLARRGPARYPGGRGALEAELVRYARESAGAGPAGEAPAAELAAVATNGSDEALQAAVLAFTRPGEAVVYLEPGFGMYPRVAEVTGRRPRPVALGPRWQVDGAALRAALEEERAAGREVLAILCRPNNPTGHLWPLEEVEAAAETGAWVLVDEAYFEFAGETALGLVARHPRLLVARTFSKAFGMAGLRLGYVLGRPEAVDRLRAVLAPYSVNTVAVEAGRMLLEPERLAQVRRWIAALVAERERLAAELERIPGLAVVPSRTNFLLVEVNPAGSGWEAVRLWRALADRGVLLRYLGGEVERLRAALRWSVARPEEDERALEVLRRLVGLREVAG
ncbi:MAG: aminotransferase class I/II-fold pyridoxal phosphate-dependent enzyme [Bacillota bacterium]|nr:aminotransferase class I/II-fold pyridoxal phosphate-dependent enzyme [Bacillota bacterium]